MNINRLSIALKIFFWMLILVLSYVLSYYSTDLSNALPEVIIVSSFYLLIVLLNEIWFFPRFFRKKHIQLIFINLALIFLFAIIHYSIGVIFNDGHPRTIMPNHMIEPMGGDIINHMMKPPPPPMRSLFSPFFKSIFIFLLGDLLSISMLLVSELRLNIKNEEILKKEKVETELKLLKAQINPHFIFNALNNIYALSYTKSENAPESILKLSEMLRYVFHDCSHDFVLLGAEINYIQNFMAFQKMKSDHKQNISFDFTSADTSVKIAPMLFIPFIENSFKYSRVEEMSEAYVKVLIKTLDRTILFRIENSLPSSGKIVNGSGMGIENVKQRLNRLYEHSFDLEVLALEDRFVVELKIDLP